MLALNDTYRNVLSNSTVQSIERNIYSNAVARWSLDESTVRLRRADDDFEKEFAPLGRVLDTASIDNFHSWNLLNGAEYKDYLYDVPLGVDSNGNGISDGWVYISNGFDGTVLTTAENNIQKIELTVGGTNVNEPYISYEQSGMSAGDIFYISVDVKLTGDVKGRLAFTSKSSNATTFGDYFTNTDWQTVTLTATVNTGDNIIEPKLRIAPNQVGSLGYAEFRNAILVKNDFIEDIGLLTEDDNSDGVANELVLNGTAHNTYTNTVTTSQNFEITASDTTSYRAYDLFEDGFTVDDTYVVKVQGEISATANVRGRLLLQWFNDSTFLRNDFAPIVTNSGFISNEIEGIAPAAANRVIISLFSSPTVIGNTGTIKFKNITIKQTNNSVYCTKKFDKTGNGNHAIQTVEASQPRLVNAGVYDTNPDTGKISLKYDGVDDFLDTGVSSVGGIKLFADANEEFTVITNHHVPIGNEGTIIGKGAADILTRNFQLFVNGSNDSFVVLRGISQNIAVYNDFTSVIWDKTTAKYILGDETTNTLNVGTASDDTNQRIIIGARSNGTGYYLNGYISDVVIFNKALTTSQIKLLSNRLA